MSAVYELIGRLVVGYARRRFASEIQMAGLGLGALSLLALVVYILSSGRRR